MYNHLNKCTNKLFGKIPNPLEIFLNPVIKKRDLP